MRIARSVLVVLCAVLVLVPAAASAGSGALKERPIEIEWSGPFQIVPDATWCAGLEGYVGVAVTSGGRGSHLGSLTGWGRHCYDLVTGDLTGGVGAFVAANGDEVHFTYAGQIYPISATEVLIVATQVIDGGTGRFTHATGQLTSECLAEFTSEFAGVVTESHDVGVISYDASDRRRR